MYDVESVACVVRLSESCSLSSFSLVCVDVLSVFRAWLYFQQLSHSLPLSSAFARRQKIQPPCVIQVLQ